MENLKQHMTETKSTKPVFMFLPAFLFLVIGIVGVNLSREAGNYNKNVDKFEKVLIPITLNWCSP